MAFFLKMWRERGGRCVPWPIISDMQAWGRCSGARLFLLPSKAEAASPLIPPATLETRRSSFCDGGKKLLCSTWQQSFSCFFLFPAGAWWSGPGCGDQNLFVCWPVRAPAAEEENPATFPAGCMQCLAPKLQEMQGCCCEIAHSAESLQISASCFVFKWTRCSSCVCCPLETFKIKKRSYRVIPMVLSMIVSLYTLECPTQVLRLLPAI